MKMKKTIALFVMLVFVLSAFVSPVSAEEKYKEELVIGANDIIGKKDPQTNNQLVCKTVYYCIFSTLFDYDTNERIFYGDLVKDYTVNETGLVWTMHLYDNVLFHDGTKLTSKDVLFTYERARGSSFQGSKVAIIEKIETPDDYTVVMYLTEPHQEFLEVLSDPGLSILSENAITTLGDEKGVEIGSGAFKLKELVLGDYVLLERFDDYFGEMPKSKYIRIRKIAEDSTRLIALQTGEIDVCLTPATSDLQHIIEDKNLELMQLKGTKVVYFNMNVLKAPFDDIRVREAIAHCINREDILEVAADGLGVATDAIMCWSATCATENYTGFSYDIEKAKSLLAEAGYPNGFDTTITLSGSTYTLAAQVLQAQLKQIGINATIETLETAVANENFVRGDFSTAINNWSWTSSNDTPLRGQFGSTSGNNYSHLYDTKIDELLDAALYEIDPAKRVAIYEELHQYLINSAAYDTLFVADLNIAIRNNVKGKPGVNWKAHGRHDFSNVYVELS